MTTLLLTLLLALAYGCGHSTEWFEQLLGGDVSAFGWLLWGLTVLYGVIGLYTAMTRQMHRLPISTWWATVPLGLVGALLIAALGWSPWNSLWWCLVVDAVAVGVGARRAPRDDLNAWRMIARYWSNGTAFSPRQ